MAKKQLSQNNQLTNIAIQVGRVAIMLAFVCAQVGLKPTSVLAAPTMNILLGRPTNHSITVNAILDQSGEVSLEYGTETGVYGAPMSAIPCTANEPVETVIDGLAADTVYYYRMLYRQTSADGWIEGDESSFRTQRAPGSTFTFTVAADSHLGQYGGQTADEKALYQQTLLNVVADHPDFHIDLGDTFAMDPSPLGTGMTDAEAKAAYVVQRPFLALFNGSIPFYFVLGNHENEEGWNFDDVFTAPDQSLAKVGMKYRKLYYPVPVPDDFYTGNDDPLPEPIGGDTNQEDYYAWTWGDALFVVIDPFHYSTTWPNDDGKAYGGEGQDGEVSGNRWDWTLGIKQYLWLKQTLENSHAEYKFVFSHHVTGGETPYGRGGIDAAPYFEWGGRNADGTWGWDTHRPAADGWDVPIHQLMVANGVTAYIHGHDHMYAGEALDGIAYIECPKPDDAGYAWDPYSYGHTESLYTHADELQNSGHLRVTVSPAQVSVEYVRAYLPGDGTNDMVARSITLLPATARHMLTAAVSPSAGGIISPTAGSHIYPAGTVVPITATANSGYAFSGWSGDCTGAGGCSVTMDAAKTVTAMFSLNPYTLGVTKSGTGRDRGTVTGTPSGINCGSTCAASFSPNTVVTLTATANADATFTGWSGDCNGTSTCTVTMSAAHAVTANFTLKQYAVTVSKSGAGSGTVTSKQNGIDCGPTCSATYNYNTVITLTASAITGSSFTGWSGDCSGTGACRVTMSAARSVTATFAGTTYALTVAKSGAGAGTVTSNPAGINCGSSCSAGFSPNTVVTLTATASLTSTFTGWTGACTGVGTCIVTMNAAKSVTAAFGAIPTYVLTTVASPSAGGAISPTVGAHSYISGTVVPVTATANAGYTFSAWSGACTGTAPCSVTMNAAKTVTATFAAITYMISGNAGAAGATLRYTDGTAKTAIADGTGAYTVTVSYNWSGTVTPSLTGYAFSPTSKTYANVTANKTGENYTATLAAYTISGNAGVAGATLSYTDGTAKTAIADGAGAYTVTVSYNWSGTVTPAKTGYTFSPAGWTYSNVTTNQTGQNYTATAITYTISGNAGVAGATLSYTDGTAKIATADGSGTYTLTVSYNWSGTVTPAKTGYTFSPASRPYSNVTANQTSQNYTANLITYTLTYTPGAHGSITGTSPQTVAYGASGAAVTAIPATGYHFMSWSDGLLTASRTDTNVTANIYVTASFAVNTFTLNYAAGTNGTLLGNATQTVNYSEDGSAITAVPNTGYHFVGWSDGSTANPRMDSNVTANVNVTASFAVNTFTLTYTPGAHGSITGTSPQTVAYGTSGAAVTAVPATGYHFVSWSDGLLTPSRTDTNVTANINVTASFAVDTFTLTYTAGTHGSITGASPQTVAYGASGTAVTAIPATGYHFVSWSDGLLTPSRTDTNVTANVNVTASFAVNTFTLNYAAGTNGTLLGNTTQTVNYSEDGSAVTAVPNTGYHFVGWSDGSTANPRMDSNVTANVNVTASFAVNTFTLTYTPGAHGSITGTSPQTVAYGASGAAVTAVPATGYHFVKWSDDVLTPSRTDINVTVNINVTASFAVDIFTLTYTAGTHGSITGASPQTVAYGASGTAVTAVPATGYHFVKWGDGILAPSRTDTNVMANVNVTASFEADPVDLSISVSDGAASIEPGGWLTYTLTVANAGPAAAVGAPVTFTVPADLTNITWCGNVLPGTVNLLAGGTATYTVKAQVKPSATGSLMVIAEVAAPAGLLDSNLANNQANDATNVVGIPITGGQRIYLPIIRHNTQP